MRIEYSKRAISDLRNIGRYYRDSAGPTIAAAIEARIRQVVARVCPGAAKRKARRSTTRRPCRAAAPVSLQDLLQGSGRYDPNTARTAHVATAVARGALACGATVVASAR
jgi:plasmid stabilization system protein ParE